MLEGLKQWGFYPAQQLNSPLPSQQTVKNAARLPLVPHHVVQWSVCEGCYLLFECTAHRLLCACQTLQASFQEIRGTGASHRLWNPATIQSYSMADSHLSRSTGFFSFYLIVHRGAALHMWETIWTWLLARLSEIDVSMLSCTATFPDSCTLILFGKSFF